MKARFRFAALAWTLIVVLAIPATAAMAQESTNLILPADDDFLSAASSTTLRERAHPWTVGAGLRYTILGGDEAGDSLTGAGTADFDYSNVFDNGFGFWVEGTYNYNEDPDELNWGPYAALNVDVFSGEKSLDRGIILNTDQLAIFSLLVGIKLQNEDRNLNDGIFWELRAGAGPALTSEVDGRVTTAAGALIARGNVIDGGVTGTFEVGGRVGYAETRWAIYAGFGWQFVSEPKNGNLGADPADINLFPVEVGFIYRF